MHGWLKEVHQKTVFKLNDFRLCPVVEKVWAFKSNRSGLDPSPIKYLLHNLCEVNSSLPASVCSSVK